MLVYGLTGGIGTGKSTVSKMIEEAGVPVFDADLVAREIVEPDKPAWRQIRAIFGDDVLASDRTLDRKTLAAKVFQNPELRRKLEAITHPRIRDEIGQRILSVSDGAPIAIVDAALMIETGWAKDFAGVIVVDCPADVQLKRIIARDGLTEAEAKSRIAAQMSLEDKRKNATYVIDNGGDLDKTRAQVKAILANIRKSTRE